MNMVNNILHKEEAIPFVVTISEELNLGDLVVNIREGDIELFSVETKDIGPVAYYQMREEKLILYSTSKREGLVENRVMLGDIVSKIYLSLEDTKYLERSVDTFLLNETQSESNFVFKSSKKIEDRLYRVSTEKVVHKKLNF